ncbi:restriction endonuclease [Streptomyces sp. NPDC050564]|uniref:restriction endonuclease n=1 Tax=Streptomyces sp. NPDC050564 TaxID=3365631 RepID=UPI0037969F74
MAFVVGLAEAPAVIHDAGLIHRGLARVNVPIADERPLLGRRHSKKTPRNRLVTEWHAKIRREGARPDPREVPAACGALVSGQDARRSQGDCAGLPDERGSPSRLRATCPACQVRAGTAWLRRSSGAPRCGRGAAWEPTGWPGTDRARKSVLQCKPYTRPVGSREVQTFNGTPRPEHGAHHPIMIGLSGFTQPAITFTAWHAIVLVGRSSSAGLMAPISTTSSKPKPKSDLPAWSVGCGYREALQVVSAGV